MLLAPAGVPIAAPTRVPMWCLTAGAFTLLTRFTDHLCQGRAVAAAAFVMARSR